MITEDYVSFETAKLLKEKGFDWETKFGQHIWDRSKRFENNRNFNSEKYLVSLPTLDVAQRWLREVKKMCLVVFPVENRFTFKIVKLGEKFNQDDYILEYNTYEDAQEEGINRALENLI